MRPSRRSTFLLCLLAAACEPPSDDTADTADTAPALVSVGGTALGVLGQGLVLQDNEADDLDVEADGAFTFASLLPFGDAYEITVLAHPVDPDQQCAVVNGSGVAMGDVDDVVVVCETEEFFVGGTVLGLFSVLVVANDDGDPLPLLDDGPFTFPTPLVDGDPYAVTVVEHPTLPSQLCAVQDGSGTIDGADVTDVLITCSGFDTSGTFTVGGTVTGLHGNVLVLQNNDGDDLALTADGAFTFSERLADLQPYDVTVLVQPSGPTQVCAVSDGTGNVAGADVDDVAVDCLSYHPVGGSVAGLQGAGLVLDDGVESLGVDTGGVFTFPTLLAEGADYAVTVTTDPSSPSQTCGVDAGSGTVAGPVDDVRVTCATDTFTVGGTVAGLQAELILHNNGGDAMVLDEDGAFAFDTALPDLSAYLVTVATQPTVPSQTCVVEDGGGNLAGANVTDIAVTCTTNTYIVSGTVSGLVGSGLELDLNTVEQVHPSADGGFAFTTALQDLSSYTVTVTGQPTGPAQTCEVSGGAGSLSGADVTDLAVTCTTDPYCGDGNPDDGEECDDGGNEDGDGCTATCLDEYCGDGVDNDGDNEECDDGGNDDRDGCSATCGIEAFLGGLAWRDANRDGVQDVGEIGFVGVTVNLLGEALAVDDTTITDTDGTFGFYVPAGDWTIEVEIPPSYLLTDPDVGADDTLDSDVSPFDVDTGRSGVLTLAMGESADVDVGFVTLIGVLDPTFSAGDDAIDGCYVYAPTNASDVGQTVRVDAANDRIVATGSIGGFDMALLALERTTGHRDTTFAGGAGARAYHNGAGGNATDLGIDIEVYGDRYLLSGHSEGTVGSGVFSTQCRQCDLVVYKVDTNGDLDGAFADGPPPGCFDASGTAVPGCYWRSFGTNDDRAYDTDVIVFSSDGQPRYVTASRTLLGLNQGWGTAITVVTENGEPDAGFSGANNAWAGITGGPGDVVEGNFGAFLTFEEVLEVPGGGGSFLVAGLMGNTNQDKAFVQRFEPNGSFTPGFAECGEPASDGICTLESGQQVPATFCYGAPGYRAGFYDMDYDGAGNVVAVGFLIDEADGEGDVLVVRFTPQGCVLDAWTYDNLPGDEWVVDLEVDADGNLYGIGYAVSGTAFDAMVLKVDAGGVLDPTFGDSGVAVLDNVAGGGLAPDVQRDTWNGGRLDGERLLVTGTSHGTAGNQDFTVCALRVADPP